MEKARFLPKQMILIYATLSFYSFWMIHKNYILLKIWKARNYFVIFVILRLKYKLNFSLVDEVAF